jgi:hypothetical protein
MSKRLPRTGYPGGLGGKGRRKREFRAQSRQIMNSARKVAIKGCLRRSGRGTSILSSAVMIPALSNLYGSRVGRPFQVRLEQGVRFMNVGPEVLLLFQDSILRNGFLSPSQ